MIDSNRFWSKVNKHGPRAGRLGRCWLWMGGCTQSGYGRFSIHSRMHRAHRVAWELTNGPIPEGICVLHRCDNPPCVRPSHLWLGTAADNQRDCVIKGRHPEAVRVRCIRGHLFDRIDNRGKRQCRTCNRNAARHLWREKRYGRQAR